MNPVSKNMKRAILIVTMGVWALVAQADTNNYPLTPGVGITAGDPVGLMETFNVTGLEGTMTNIQVALDITGGFNGNLYAYLVSPNGSIAILLNRVGVNGGNSFGYSDAGFDITLDDSGSYSNVHTYGSGSYSINGSGQVTGTWASDGENVNPLGPLVGSSASTATLANLLGSDPDGTWTFFIADLESGGGTPTLSSVTLTIMTVPEPSGLALTGLGLAGGALLLFRRVSVKG